MNTKTLHPLRLAAPAHGWLLLAVLAVACGPESGVAPVGEGREPVRPAAPGPQEMVVDSDGDLPVTDSGEAGSQAPGAPSAQENTAPAAARSDAGGDARGGDVI
ncbi:MAG: hypothetical protein QF615_09125, partial [Planctomycetota bacterium]|nr:hypothetical protein [Planctomycetota bacterium]